MSDVEDHIKEEGMEDVQVSHSPSSHYDGQADGLFVDGDKTTNTSISPETASMGNPSSEIVITTNRNEMVWHQCDFDSSLTDLQRVKIKEQASKDAIHHMLELLPKLEEQKVVLSTSIYMERIDSLIKDSDDSLTTIGFMGVTGAGKSSIINGILEIEDFLPADDGPACTASAIKIAYNYDDDPEKSFRALIEFYTKADLKTELDSLLSDINDEKNDDPNSEPDEERDERIEKSLTWLRTIMPSIKTKSEFMKIGVNKILNDKRLGKLLGQENEFQTSDRAQFSAFIKPFIDSSDDSTKAMWPLVKVVRLYAKSPILSEGICLVDLPGTCDTNTARGAIADKFQRDLTITCVVAESLRAESNKSAQDLLGTVRQRTMQLENQFAADRLCFIISKCDQSIKIPRYILNHVKLQKQVAAETKNGEKVQNMKKTAEKCLANKKQEASGLELQIKALKKKLVGLGDVPVALPQKRKLHGEGSEDSAVQKLQKQLQDVQQKNLQVQSEQLAAERKIQELNRYLKQSESRKKRACIQHRNKVSSDSLKKDYNHTAKITGIKNSKELKVFSVSAQAYMERMNGLEPDGFLTNADTGIPDLQNWFIQASLPSRKAYYDTLLNNFVSLEKSIVMSLAGTSMSHKMSKVDNKRIKGIFDRRHADLASKFSEENETAANKCKELVQTGLFNKFPRSEKVAAASAIIEVVQMHCKLHWSTFRMTNRKSGKYTPVRKIKGMQEINWNANLAGCYLDQIMKAWNVTLFNKVPGSRALYKTNTQEHLEDFIKEIKAIVLDICPDIARQIEQWGINCLSTGDIIDQNASKVYGSKIEKWIKSTHPKVGQEVLNTWDLVYELCGRETGKGHFTKIKKIHNDHVNNSSSQMYKNASATIRADLRSLIGTLPQEFDIGTGEAVRQIKHDFNSLLKNHTVIGDQDTDHARFLLEKEKLEKFTKSIFNAIRADWKKKMEFERVEDEVVTELPFPTLDGLYGSKDD